MQDVYTIKKVSVETEAGYIYNFEDLPQDNLYLKIRNLFLPNDRKAIKRGQEILQNENAQLNIERKNEGKSGCVIEMKHSD